MIEETINTEVFIVHTVVTETRLDYFIILKRKVQMYFCVHIQ